jgi:arrestin-related trafficking adapter 3/6
VPFPERIDNFANAINLTRTTTNVIHLLNLQHNDDTTPLLPLDSDDPLAYEKSPLSALRRRGASPSEAASQLLGLGPWHIRAKLHLPADCNMLHATNKCKDSTVRVTHKLCFTIHVSSGDDSRVDSKPAKRKLVEVILRLPVNILSVR